MRKIRFVLLAVACTISMLVNVCAEEVVNTVDSHVLVQLTVEPAIFSVTVPTSLLISVDGDGVVTTPDDVKIVNNSLGAVVVKGMSIESKNDWFIASYSGTNMNAVAYNSKTVAFKINNEETDNDGNISFNAANFPMLAGQLDDIPGIDAGADTLPIKYTAKVSANSGSISGFSIAAVSFVVGWYE